MKTIKKTTKPKQTKKTGTVQRKKNFRTYSSALAYLFDRTNYETQKRLRYNVDTFDLSRMEKLLTLLGNPEKKFESIHIAGTKGKGSTSTMLAKMLEANDYSVGLYTSPHVSSIHERIAVNSELISEDQMRKLISRVYGPVEQMTEEGLKPTFFELMTSISFMYFADMKVDIAVVETGLGGRLDSTNVLNPRLVGITSISIDHQNQLGSKIELIAKEKAGIIKQKTPVVTVPQHPDAMKEIRFAAIENAAPLCVTGDDIDFSYRFESSREHGPHTRICLTTPTSKFEHLRVPLPGEHQAINCGLALAMLDHLKNDGMDICDEKSLKGLHSTKMIGRMEMIYDDPRVIVDAAHNAASIKALVQAIGQHVPYDSMVIIFGCNNDKDVHGMLKQLQFGADKVIFTRSNNPKAVAPEELAEMYTEISGKMCQTAITLGSALQIAKSGVCRGDLICITGSFSLVGQAKSRLQNK